MKTADLLSETKMQQFRYGGVLYGGFTNKLLKIGMKHADFFKSFITTLDVPKRFMDEHLHVNAYDYYDKDNKNLITIATPLPNGIDADQVEFFTRMAEILMDKYFVKSDADHMKIGFKNKGRQYHHGVDEFTAHMNRRRNTLTDDDMVVFEVVA